MTAAVKGARRLRRRARAEIRVRIGEIAVALIEPSGARLSVAHCTVGQQLQMAALLIYDRAVQSLDELRSGILHL